MRQAGTLPHEEEARRFADYLETLGISSRVEPLADRWAVWIREENQLDRSKQELEEFVADPSAARYTGAKHEADARRRESAKRAEQARKNMIDMRQRWHRPIIRQAPLTTALIVISVVVGFLTKVNSEPNEITPYLLISQSAPKAAAAFDEQLPEIRQGQVWRLVTPIFVHFGGLHLFFNMYWLYVLGGMIEMRKGTWQLALLVFTAALISNLAQFYTSGKGFGGMSGVVYALFGYSWMKMLFDPHSGIWLPPNTVFMMVAFFVLCMTGTVGPIANVAHGAGLAIGMIMGYLPTQWRRAR
jgi:GlpG protein